MNKLKKFILIALISCLAVCTAIALAACDKSISPQFRNPNPDAVENDDDYNGKYVINVKSAGGLALRDVTVTAKLNGEEVLTGISSEEGKIEFALTAGVYDLEVNKEKLPAGYFVPEGAEYKTSVSKANVDVVLSSKVISSAAVSSTRYRLGDVMHDFSYTNTYGMQYTLSELLETKKAVVLNFWYVDCSACQLEFPAIEKAYKAYSDKVSIVALDPSSNDKADDISKFQQDYGLTFHMARDNAEIYNMFGVTAYPTTVMVDRYGVVCEVHEGSIPSEATWKALFNKYTSDNYTQDQNPSGDTETPTERTKYDGSIVMPASEKLAAAVLGEGTEDRIGDFRPETNETDAEYSWPWIVGDDGTYMTASNSKIIYSYAIVYVDVTLESGEALSYEYKVDTEADTDIMYAQVNGKIVGEYSGDSSAIEGNKDGWVEDYGVYVADHTVTVTLSFIYIKDPQLDEGTDSASIRNITITDVASNNRIAVDQRIAVTDGKALQSDKTYGINVEYNNENGYYYYVDEKNDKFILLANIIESTFWAEKHLGRETVGEGEGARNPASLYHLSYWLMSNYLTQSSDGGLKFNYGDADLTKLIIKNYDLQGFSDNRLVPVTEELKNAIIAFTEAYCGEHNIEYYEDQWLEMCYYFRHYGAPRHDMTVTAEQDKDNCSRYKDPILGLTSRNPHTINFQGTSVVQKVNITKIIHNDGGGLWYKMNIDKAGIYRFSTTYIQSNKGIDPRVLVYDSSLNLLMDQDDDVRYDRFSRSRYDNFNVYAYIVLDVGTYYVQGASSTPGAVAEYDLLIEYLNDKTSVSFLRVCSTDDGLWTYKENSAFTYYLAIPVALNSDGYYYENRNNKFGSKIYIDFVHGNFFDENNHSLEWMINNNYFGSNTARMRQFLLQSMQGKTQKDELYGVLEASSELVNMLAAFIQGFSSDYQNDALNSGAWMMFACYYEYYTVKA